MSKHLDKSNLKYSRSRKAWNAGITGAAAALGTISLAGLLTDTGVNAEAIGVAAGLVVTGFVGPFVAAFFSRNEG